MDKNSSLKQFLINIYGYTFFNALMWLAPVYTVFMQANGVSDMGISILLILWSGAIILTQFPLTWLARKTTAQNMMFASQTIKITAFILWILWPCFTGFAIGIILWGMHGAIYDTVSENVLYNGVRARTHKNIYTKILGQRRNFASIGKALSAAGSLMMFWGYTAITAATVVCLVISMLFLIRMQFDDEYSGAQQNVGLISQIKTGISAFRNAPVLVALLALCVMVTNFSYLNDYLGLIGVDIGLRPEFIGIVPFFILCCQMLGQGIAHKFYLARWATLYSLVIVSGGLFVLFSWYYSVWALVALGVAYTMCSVVKIVTYSHFQDRTPAKHRIEVLSIYSITDQSTYMLVSLIIGLGSMLGGWRYSVLILGCLLLMVGVMATMFMHRHERNHRTMERAPVPNTTLRADGIDVI